MILSLVSNLLLWKINIVDYHIKRGCVNTIFYSHIVID